MRIEQLTPTEFHERPLDGPPPFAASLRGLSPHHVSWCDDVFACDVRDRVSYGQHVPVFRQWALRPAAEPFEDCAPARESVR